MTAAVGQRFKGKNGLAVLPHQGENGAMLLASESRAKSPRRKGEPMNENEIAKIVVDACYIHTRLGPGLLESV